MVTFGDGYLMVATDGGRPGHMSEVGILLFMRRIQIHLDEELDEALARQAHDKGISKAALIRHYLRQHVTKDVRGKERPSRLLIGVFEGSSDESASIDDVVYGR